MNSEFVLFYLIKSIVDSGNYKIELRAPTQGGAFVETIFNGIRIDIPLEVNYYYVFFGKGIELSSEKLKCETAVRKEFMKLLDN